MWPGCASGCHGQKREVHLPSCAQKYFQHSLHVVWKTKPSSEAQHSWLPTPKTWSDHTAFGNFCLANTTLAKLNLFCHQELHNQLRRGSVCVSASPSKCGVLLRQVYASKLNKRSYSELFWRFPEAFFHLHSLSSASAGGPMNFYMQHLDQIFSNLLCCHFCTCSRIASLTWALWDYPTLFCCCLDLLGTCISTLRSPVVLSSLLHPSTEKILS